MGKKTLFLCASCGYRSEATWVNHPEKQCAERQIQTMKGSLAALANRLKEADETNLKLRVYFDQVNDRYNEMSSRFMKARSDMLIAKRALQDVMEKEGDWLVGWLRASVTRGLEAISKWA